MFSTPTSPVDIQSRTLCEWLEAAGVDRRTVSDEYGGKPATVSSLMGIIRGIVE